MKSNSNPRENGSISTSFSKLILHDETPSIICQTRPDSPLLNNDKHTSPPGEQTSATQATPKAKNNVAEHGRKIQKQNSFTRWRYGSTSSTDSVFAAHENRTRESWFSDVYSHHSSMQSRSNSFSFRPLIHSRSQVGNIRCSSTSSGTDVVIPLNLHQSQLASEAIRAPRIHRITSTGQELTREHWKNIKMMEDKAERSLRCSKLSSGFAPIMLFGGLVFICIGISASTNTGKDREKLKNLSVGPLTVGVFMLLFAMFLILMWLCCRSRAKTIDHKLLHGPQDMSNENELSFFRTAVTKLRNRFYLSANHNEQEHGSLSPEPPN